MFDAPLDAWYVWLGLSVASVAVFGVVTSLSVAPPPDAAAVADTIDRVAATAYDTTASRTLDAREVRIGPQRIGLRTDAGTAHATLAFPVVPVDRGSRAARLLHGAPPAAVFPSAAAFDRAVDRAQRREPSWTPAGERLVVRHLVWGEVDVTLVGTGAGSTPAGSPPAESARTAPTTATGRPDAVDESDEPEESDGSDDTGDTDEAGVTPR